MCSKKVNSIFKVLDRQGRVSIPPEWREATDIEIGDIIEIKKMKNGFFISKLDVIKLDDDSKETLKNTVLSASKKLDKKSLLQLTQRLAGLAERMEE